MASDEGKLSSRGGSSSISSSSRASSRSDSTPGSHSAAEPWSPDVAARPADPSPFQARPTELILDFSAPGRDTRRPLTRRGHVKSRLGCLSCKRRRVKCDERHPVCGQCNRLKLSCSYPPETRRQKSEEKKEDSREQSQQHVEKPASVVPVQHEALPRSVGTAMNLDHLAFYHQFLTVAYPTIPIKERSAWADCAAMSHHVSSPQLLPPPKIPGMHSLFTECSSFLQMGMFRAK